MARRPSRAAVITAGTRLAAVDQIRVAQLNAVVHAAVEHFAVQNDAAAKPRAERQQNARFAAGERALIKLGQRRAVCVVRNIDGNAGELLLQQLPQGYIVEIQIVRVKNRLAARVDAAGDDRAERADGAKRRVLLFQQRKDCRADLFRQIRRRRVRERDRRLGGQLQRLVQQADLDVGSADVNADLIHMQCLFSFQPHPWTLRVSGHFLLKIIRRSSQKSKKCCNYFFSGSRVRASPSYPQEKVALAILEDAVLFHPSKLQRQAAALDAKIIRKLLS